MRRIICAHCGPRRRASEPSHAGDQRFGFIGNGAFTDVAGQLRWEDVAADKVVQADTNGDGSADFKILLQNYAGLPLVAGDFVL
jgi:hypothetical protein